MVLLDPVEGVGDQEIGNLVLFVVKYLGAPVGMLALSGVRVFVQRLAVKISQTVGVSWEMGRNPV
jgi:hypothetical protein